MRIKTTTNQLKQLHSNQKVIIASWIFAKTNYAYNMRRETIANKWSISD